MTPTALLELDPRTIAAAIDRLPAQAGAHVTRRIDPDGLLVLSVEAPGARRRGKRGR